MWGKKMCNFARDCMSYLSASCRMQCLKMFPVMKPGAGQQPAGSAGHEETESSCKYHPVTWADFVSTEVLPVVKPMNVLRLVVILTSHFSDKETGTVSLICELMEMNIYEFIQGRHLSCTSKRLNVTYILRVNLRNLFVNLSRTKNTPARPHNKELYVPALQITPTHAQVVIKRILFIAKKVKQTRQDVFWCRFTFVPSFLLLFFFQLWDLSQRCEARKHSHQSERRFTVPICPFKMQQYLSQRELEGFFFLKKNHIYLFILQQNSLKLGDFGSCRSVYSKPPHTEYISTRWYRAPECLLTDGYYSFKMDMWSTGCVFFEIMK